MLEQLQAWLLNLGIGIENTRLVAQILMLLLILIIGSLLKILIRLFIKRSLSSWIQNTNTLWDDIFYESSFFHHLGFLPPLILLFLSPAGCRIWQTGSREFHWH